jgi:hypothetical protein
MPLMSPVFVVSKSFLLARPSETNSFAALCWLPWKPPVICFCRLAGGLAAHFLRQRHGRRHPIAIRQRHAGRLRILGEFVHRFRRDRLDDFADFAMPSIFLAILSKTAPVLSSAEMIAFASMILAILAS